MSIKNLVKLFEQIGERIQPEMIGGDFFHEEKVFLIENAYIQNKWLAGKAYLKENHAADLNNTKNRVNVNVMQLTMIKKMNLDMFPSPNTIISTLCRQGTQEAHKIFNDRLKEMHKLRKVSPVALSEGVDHFDKMVGIVSIDR